MDEFAADAIKRAVLLKTLNSLSSRFFSFFNPALLGFPNKNVEVL
jgi:hypothetical protein